MVGEEHLRRRAGQRREPRVGDRHPAHEVRPAVPGPGLHLPQVVGHVGDGAAPAVVGPLVHRQQSPVGQEAQAEGVADPPAHQLHAGAVGVGPVDRRRRGGAPLEPRPVERAVGRERDLADVVVAAPGQGPRGPSSASRPARAARCARGWSPATPTACRRATPTRSRVGRAPRRLARARRPAGAARRGRREPRRRTAGRSRRRRRCRGRRTRGCWGRRARRPWR